MGADSTVAVGPADVLIVGGYIAVTSLLGIAIGWRQSNNRDYFLGSRQMPTWALLLSIVATETSTVTFLSVPGLAFIADGNFTFLQIAFGYIVGRFAIVLWLLPSYFRGEILTAYEVLEQRFGVAVRRLASLVFLVTRNFADGLRLFLAAIVLNNAFGLDYFKCVLVISAATATYSCFGGVKSVVWNDCIQFAVYIVGAIAVMFAVVAQIPGGWGEIWQFAESSGRLKLFDFDPSLTKSTVTFWSGLIGGAFLTLATHGADHMMVQRYLCAKSQASAGRALATSGFIVFLQFALFLWIGVELACFHSLQTTAVMDVPGDHALIRFVVNYTGPLLRGLVLAAVFSASMSSSLNSVTSSLMNDCFDRFVSRLSDRQSLVLARALTIVFAVIQAAVALAAYGSERAIVDMVLAIAGFSTGLILGLFALGTLSPRTSERAALVSFAVGTIATCAVAFGTDVHWLWYTLVGSGTIVIVGFALGTMFPRPTHVSEVT